MEKYGNFGEGSLSADGAGISTDTKATEDLQAWN
jgi:hypothetical protein